MREMYELLVIFPLGIFLISTTIPTLAYLIISLFDGFPRLKLMQIVGIVAMTAWLITPFMQSGNEIFFFLSAVGLIIVFFAIWRREFRLLMLRADDEFPGRFDKLGWFLMLTLCAPAGVWLFRSFRKVRWPDPISQSGRLSDAKLHPTSQSPWDREDEPSPSAAKVE